MSAAEIQDLLQKKFSPLHIQVRDKSHLHQGHSGNTGGGHYDLLLVSKSFDGQPALARHRMVYEALAMPREDIHALQMKLLTPQEYQ